VAGSSNRRDRGRYPAPMYALCASGRAGEGQRVGSLRRRPSLPRIVYDSRRREWGDCGRALELEHHTARITGGRWPVTLYAIFVPGMIISTSDGSSATVTGGSRARGTGDDPGADPIPQLGRRAFVDRLPTSVVVVLTVVGFGLPVVMFLGSTLAYSVNVVMSDNLSIMPFLKASQTQIIPWGPLWAQYNQDRSFFPNVLAVVLAHTDRLDMRVEDLIGGLMVVIGTALVILAHKRRSPSCPWLYYCPVAFITLSLVQFDNTFLGGVSWYLTFLALATTIVLLDAVRAPRLAYAGAVAAAVVGSYSSFAGLLVWPTGLALLYLRGRGWRPMVVWAASGGLAAVLYFWNFTFNTAAHPSTGYLAGHLWSATQVFLTAVGDGVGVTITPGSGPDVLIQLLGALILIVSVVAVVQAIRNRGSGDGGPVGVAMICFGVLFALSVADGRTGFGTWGASASRYTTFDLLILAGAYLGLLDSRNRVISTVAVNGSGDPDPSVDGIGCESPSPSSRRALAPVGFAVALVLVGLQVVLGTSNGLRGERAYHQEQVTAAEYLRAYRYTPDYALTTQLAPDRTASWIRRNASIAEALHLSTFSTPRSREFEPSQVTPPTPVVLLPRSGATVHGTVALDAGTDRSIGVEGIHFVISGEDATAPVRLQTLMSLYGWAVLWNSADVPDGNYTAVAVSVTYGGRTATSSTVHFHVANAITSTRADDGQGPEGSLSP